MARFNKVIFDKFIKSKREKFNTTHMSEVWVEPYYNLRDQFQFIYSIYSNMEKMKKWQIIK